MINDDLREIQELVESGRKVPRERFAQLMESDDIQVQAGVVELLTENVCVEPPLAGMDVFRFCVAYYRRVFLENPGDGEFTASLTIEGHTLATWFKELWTNGEGNAELIAGIEGMVRSTYKEGNDRTRYGIETAFLEHAFESPGLPEYFSGWQDDPTLRPAYDRAMEWVEQRRRLRQSE